MKRLVIGILAHVDSGKTTLSESLLFKSGEIRKWGRVDHGDAFLDTHSLEKTRGITIFSKQANFTVNNTKITLLDTPGHIDFSPEMERTLQVLDYAILVVSASEGVQSHTTTLWNLLKHYNIPTIIFVNKMDLLNGELSLLMNNIQSNLHENCISFFDNKDFYEAVGMCSEDLMNEYISSDSISNETISQEIKNRRLFPCVFGSALKQLGVENLLALLDTYTISLNSTKDFGAKVFKITQDNQGNRLTHLKITQGSLKVKTQLNTSKDDASMEKINQIRIYSSDKFKAVDEVFAGEVCAVTGLNNTYSGMGLGVEFDTQKPVLQPVLNYKINILSDLDTHFVLKKLKELEQEDPLLNIIWNEFLQEINIQLMGEIQMEILKSIVKERFDLDIDFGEGNIIYKESIKNTVLGVGHFEPLRHYSEVHLLLEPLPQGKGLVFATNCKEDDLARNWQQLALTHLQEKTHIGVLTGSPITDMKITLVAGKAHLKHTEGGDFRQATYRALRHGLKMAESVLLEPWYRFKIELPTEFIGRAMTDLQVMNAEFNSPETYGETSYLTGFVPVSTIKDYQISIVNYSKGKGKITLTLDGYRECHNATEVIEKINYDSELDLDNPTCSVFCKHGSGFIVKWDSVYNYMHLESKYKPSNQINFDYVSKQKNSSPIRYTGTLEQDKELLEIFQKTYTSTKNTSKPNFNPPKKEKTIVNSMPTLKYDGDEYLLVDGYNIIFAWQELKEIAQINIEAARNKLIDILENYQSYKQCELIIVFDAYKVKGNIGEIQKVNKISVVYTKEAETADMYIEKVTHKLAKNNKVRVATSDQLEQMIILGHGAFKISADMFYLEVLQVEKSIREFLTNI